MKIVKVGSTKLTGHPVEKTRFQREWFERDLFDYTKTKKPKRGKKKKKRQPMPPSTGGYRAQEYVNPSPTPEEIAECPFDLGGRVFRR